MEVFVEFGNDGFTINAFIGIDGDVWSCHAGDFATMPVGFGNTIQEAVLNFKTAIRNETPPVNVPSRPSLAPQQ